MGDGTVVNDTSGGRGINAKCVDVLAGSIS